MDEYIDYGNGITIKNGDDNIILKDVPGNIYGEMLNTLFVDAVKNKNIHNIKELLDDGRVEPRANNHFAIRFASRNGHIEVIKELLKDIRVEPQAFDNYAIRWASRNGHVEVVKELLKYGRVLPQAIDNIAIRWASNNDNINVVKLLIWHRKVLRTLDKNRFKNEYNDCIQTILSIKEMDILPEIKRIIISKLII